MQEVHSNNKKYRISDDGEVRHFGDHTLHRIQALRDIVDVLTGNVIARAGDFGGWIENENNLSIDGNCWVSDNACVFDKSSVTDDAIVSGRAIVMGDNWIGECSRVYDRASISGEGVMLFEQSSVYGNAEIIGKNSNSLIKLRHQSRVFGNASITGNGIMICNRSVVRNHTILKGSNILVAENASVGGYGKIGDNVNIMGNASLRGSYIVRNDVSIHGNASINNRRQSKNPRHAFSIGNSGLIDGLINIRNGSRIWGNAKIFGDLSIRDNIDINGCLFGGYAYITSNRDFMTIHLPDKIRVGNSIYSSFTFYKNDKGDSCMCAKNGAGQLSVYRLRNLKAGLIQYNKADELSEREKIDTEILLSIIIAAMLYMGDEIS